MKCFNGIRFLCENFIQKKFCFWKFTPEPSSRVSTNLDANWCADQSKLEFNRVVGRRGETCRGDWRQNPHLNLYLNEFGRFLDDKWLPQPGLGGHRLVCERQYTRGEHGFLSRRQAHLCLDKWGNNVSDKHQ